MPLCICRYSALHPPQRCLYTRPRPPTARHFSLHVCLLSLLTVTQAVVRSVHSQLCERYTHPAIGRMPRPVLRNTLPDRLRCGSPGVPCRPMPACHRRRQRLNASTRCVLETCVQGEPHTSTVKPLGRAHFASGSGRWVERNVCVARGSAFSHRTGGDSPRAAVLASRTRGQGWRRMTRQLRLPMGRARLDATAILPGDELPSRHQPSASRPCAVGT